MTHSSGRSILRSGETPTAAELIRGWRRRLLLSAVGALSACGGAGYSPVIATTNAAEAPQVQSAAYYAFVEPLDASASFGGMRGPAISLETEGRRCAHYLSQASEPIEALAGDEDCPADLARLLRAHERDGRMVLVVDGEGQERDYRSPADLAPIDTPAAALAAAWLHGGYALSFENGQQYLGSLSEGQVRAVDGGFEVTVGAEQSEGDCQETRVHQYRVTLVVGRDGSIEERGRVETDEYVDGNACMPLGRRPEHFVDRDGARSLESLVARAAHHEAESVRAFARFARELEAFGAPAALVKAARTAATDEVRHARMWGALGRRMGFEIDARIAQDHLAVRSLEEVARDNAVEGCVYETFGAALALYQARHAQTPALRAHFASIASDELDHAALSRACADFFEARLDAPARRRMRAAAARAREELARSFTHPTAAEALLGYPAQGDARRLWASVA